MTRYGVWFPWLAELRKIYRDGGEGVGPGEVAICSDERSEFYGTKPQGGRSRVDHISGFRTGETKQPDSSGYINSGKAGRIFAHRLAEGLARATESLHTFVLEGAKLKKELTLTSTDGTKKLFRDYNRELKRWKDQPETLSEKFESGEITPNEVCYVNQLARDILLWKRMNNHLRGVLDVELHPLAREYDGIIRFYSNMVDPSEIFKSDVLNLVSPFGWVAYERSDYRRILDFKRCSAGRLKFQVRNIPSELFSAGSSSYGNGNLDVPAAPEGNLSQESLTDAGEV